MIARAKMRIALRFAPFVVSAGLIAFLLGRVEELPAAARFDWCVLSVAVVISVAVNVLVGSFKWWRVLELSGIRATYGEVCRIWTGLFPVAFFMPFQSGHLLNAVALQEAKQTDRVVALENVAYDKYLNLVATFLWIGVGQFLLASDHPLRRNWILAVAAAALVFFAFDRWVFGVVRGMVPGLNRTRILGRRIGAFRKLVLLILAAAIQSTDLIVLYLVCRSLGAPVPVSEVVGIYSVIVLLSYIPVTFSGFGAREGLIALLFVNVLTYDQAIAAGLLVDLVEYVAPALFGLVAVRTAVALLAAGSPSWFAAFRTIAARTFRGER